MPPERHRTTPIVRVRTGCWSCRRRKKKCDEVRPICGGCKRNDLGCEWPTVIPGRRNSGAPNDLSHADLETRRSSPFKIIEEIDSAPIPGSPASSRRQSSTSSPSSGGRSPGGDSIVDSTSRAQDQNQIADRRNSYMSSTSNIDNHDATLISIGSVGNVVPRTMSMLPGYDPDSYTLISHYLSTTADCMANGTTPVNPFLVQIVPLAFTSDLLLQLVIAQSAAHRAFRRRDESDAIAQSHYTKAIQLFRSGVTEFIDGKEPNPLMLLVGALLMCFTETTKGDMTGTVFDHLTAANSLLIKLLAQSDRAVPRELKDFVIEYYVYTASVSMISIDARLSGQLFLNFDLEQRARELLTMQYVGNLCGCWLELLLLIPVIFDLGRQWMMEETHTVIPTADDIAMFASIQAQILRWTPFPSVDPEVYLAGLIFQQAMLIYLYTSLGGYKYTQEGMYRGLIQTAVTEAMSYLDELPANARINSGMCWPIAVIGSCLETIEQQGRLRTRLAAMASHFGIGNMHRTLQLLEAIWHLPTADTGPWNICRSMQQKEIWISFA
ncbi:hypothetical protein N7478_011861 [Penicillium angulare]|uniref:uncharacterized protein n=1 Tax=Penicillium angulare TaxID=116970 RepID=UPI00254243F3|nr:uncharacterized protein N7478_011861 [Penicillium angulare]KAJ5261266.1 hypothetical protein N7478_011861 [Penicillium angulare]